MRDSRVAVDGLSPSWPVFPSPLGVGRGRQLHGWDPRLHIVDALPCVHLCVPTWGQPQARVWEAEPLPCVHLCVRILPLPLAAFGGGSRPSGRRDGTVGRLPAHRPVWRPILPPWTLQSAKTIRRSTPVFDLCQEGEGLANIFV